jgi:hypothetical protein
MRTTLDRFFDRANHLNGLLHHLDAQLQWFRDSIRNAQQGSVAHLAAGSKLVIRDLTESSSHGCPVFYSSGGFGTSGQAFLDLVDVHIARESAWATAQGLEALETCVKDLLAAYYLANPLAVDPAAPKNARQFLNRAGHSRRSSAFWSTYVRDGYRSADRVLAEIRRISPQLEDAEKRNNCHRDVVGWFAVVSEVRHAVVHSNLIIAKRTWDEWSDDRRLQTETLFSGTSGPRGFELRPSIKQATEALTGLAEYGYAAFKALSIAGQTEWLVFPEQSER